MKRIASKCCRAAVAGAVLLCIGCGPKPKTGTGYTDAIPREIRDMIHKHYRESIYAVGSAVGPTEALAQDKATLNARAEIARQFKSNIDVLQKGFEESVNREAMEEYTQVMQSFASLEISGSQVVKTLVQRHRAEGYGAKVLVVVSAQHMKAIIDEHMNSYTSFMASKAYKELEERVRRERELQDRQQDEF